MKRNQKQAVSIALTALLALSVPTAQALKLGDVLKDAVSEQLNLPTQNSPEQTSNQSNTPANSASTTASESASPSNALANINWKKPSREEEIAIGRQVTGSLLGAAPLVNDDGLQRYVNQVGRWVASQSERADLPWKFGVMDSADINAFAAPGGYILITKGLYQQLQSESQLAGVLAHEVAHVVKKHQLKVMQKQALLDAGANWLKEKVSKNKITQKALSTGAEISARNLDKSAEYEADSMGLVLAARAGYEPYGLAEVLQGMSQMSKNDNSVSLLFKTHPHPDERLTQLGLLSGNQLDSMSNGKTLEQRLYPLR